MKKPFKKPLNFKQKEAKHLCNNLIIFDELRMIGEHVNAGEIYKTSEALKISRTLGLDLVVTTPKAIPPIAKILDYSKFLYEEEKRKKEFDKKQKENNKPLKEVRMSPNISSNDENTKTKHIKNFLEEKHKVKVVVAFSQGREIRNSLITGQEIMLRIIETLGDISTPDAEPKMVGKNLSMVLTPKK
jgi:translation initiation factor IF-3